MQLIQGIEYYADNSTHRIHCLRYNVLNTILHRLLYIQLYGIKIAIAARRNLAIFYNKVLIRDGI